MRRDMLPSFRSLVGALLVWLAGITGGGAQTLDLDTLGARAEAGEAAAQRDFGEALVYGIGGAEQDVVRGLRLLEQAAINGDPGAQAILGKLLVDGVYAERDAERGYRFLREAANAGNVNARTALGVALLWGLDMPADPEAARGQLEAAAAQGGAEAARVLGEVLLYGWTLDQDTEAGLALLEKAVASGDTRAKIALGSAYFDGKALERDRARAVALFEDAAADGDGEGLEALGAELMWSRRDASAGEAYLRRAGELARVSAWETLAEGAMYGFLGQGSRGKFDGFAEKARAAGSTRIAVLEAERQMWGISMRASGPKTIEGLETAARDGNPDAARFLISLVRDGNQMNIRKRPEEARGYFEEFADLLTETEKVQYAFSIDAAEAGGPGDFKALAAQFYAMDRAVRSAEFGREIFSANPNLAVYLLQTDMSKRGTYAGAVNGLATKSTLRALWRACRTLPDPGLCGDAVMRPEVIGEFLAR